MLENMADDLEDSMKKGFLNIISLSILGEKPSHGYKIKKNIKKNTYGIWTPPDSSLYTTLKQMTQNGLIMFTEKLKGAKIRKVYHLTQKGKKLLKIISKRRSRIINSIISLLISILPYDESKNEDITKSQLYLLNNSLLENLPDEKKIKIMMEQKVMISQQMEFFAQYIENLNANIDKMTNKS